jgi:hypothetical protein
VTLSDGQQHSFAIDPFRKICLLEGWMTSATSVLKKQPLLPMKQLRPTNGRFDLGCGAT